MYIYKNIYIYIEKKRKTYNMNHRKYITPANLILNEKQKKRNKRREREREKKKVG